MEPARPAFLGREPALAVADGPKRDHPPPQLRHRGPGGTAPPEECARPLLVPRRRDRKRPGHAADRPGLAPGGGARRPGRTRRPDDRAHPAELAALGDLRGQRGDVRRLVLVKAGADVAELRARQGAREPAAARRTSGGVRSRPDHGGPRRDRLSASGSSHDGTAESSANRAWAARRPRSAAGLRIRSAPGQDPQPSREVALERGRSAAAGDGLANQVRRIREGLGRLELPAAGARPGRSPRPAPGAEATGRAPPRRPARRRSARPALRRARSGSTPPAPIARPRWCAHRSPARGYGPAGPVIGDHSSHRGEQVGQRLPDRGGRARLVQTEHRRRPRAALPGVEPGYRAWRHARLATGSTSARGECWPRSARPGSSSRAPPRDSPCRRRSPPRAPRPRRRSI